MANHSTRRNGSTALSTVIGTPSMPRSRTISTTGAAAAICRSPASSKVAGRVCRSRTLEVARRPRCAASSVKEISWLGGSPSTSWGTNQPRCADGISRPSSASWTRASRRVERLTFSLVGQRPLAGQS